MDFLLLQHSFEKELRLDGCFTERDFSDCSALPELFALQKFSMRDVGLIYAATLHTKMPNLEVLDLQDNRIYEIEMAENMQHFKHLVEVNLSNNPIQVHAELQKMITDANPLIEVVNKRQIHEIGYREREEIRKLRQEIIEYEMPTLGTHAGDRLLAEGLDSDDVSVEDLKKKLHSIDK